MSHNVLILFAHPQKEKSQINLRIIETLRKEPLFIVHDLYDAYPDFFIDVAREQKLLLEAELIAVVHPLYWYSTPAILKEWQDAVWSRGWAYGKDGDKLKGKHIRHIISTGGPESAYANSGYNRFPLDDFLRPLEQSATLCQMKWHRPLVIYGSFTATVEKINTHAQHVLTELKHFSLSGSFSSADI